MAKEDFIIPEGCPVAPNKFDVRVLNKNLKNGLITQDDLKAHLSNVSDDESFSESVDYNSVVQNEEFEDKELEASQEEASAASTPLVTGLSPQWTAQQQEAEAQEEAVSSHSESDAPSQQEEASYPFRNESAESSSDSSGESSGNQDPSSF